MRFYINTLNDVPTYLALRHLIFRTTLGSLVAVLYSVHDCRMTLDPWVPVRWPLTPERRGHNRPLDPSLTRWHFDPDWLNAEQGAMNLAAPTHDINVFTWQECVNKNISLLSRLVLHFLTPVDNLLRDTVEIPNDFLIWYLIGAAQLLVSIEVSSPYLTNKIIWHCHKSFSQW